jgi:DNA-binding response OmpR family regulator
MKIVVIDDEADIGFILSFELQNLGHQVVSFSSVTEAQKYLEKESPEAIICDFQMPKMNGHELYLWLKHQEREIPFYILTGEPTMNTDLLLKSGIKDVLFKPQDLLRIPALFK